MINNLELWHKVEKTDPRYTKRANVRGNNITAIAPHSQILSATEEFGKYGEKWGFKQIDYNYELVTITGVIVFHGVFYFPNGQFPISSSISAYKDSAKTKPDSDFAKKVETDALTKALSKLGFNADVFMGLYDDNKYVQSMFEEFKPTKIYKTPSKQTLQDKKDYWAEFSNLCKSLDVEAIEFIIDWIGLDMEDKSAIQGAVAKYLKDKDMFIEQLQNYKDNKRSRE
jgi:ribonuclease HI